MMLRRLLRWFFLNRQTGEVTIAQAPNLTLWIVILTESLLWLWPDRSRIYVPPQDQLPLFNATEDD
jgi:hypothetical protein